MWGWSSSPISAQRAKATCPRYWPGSPHCPCTWCSMAPKFSQMRCMCSRRTVFSGSRTAGFSCAGNRQVDGNASPSTSSLALLPGIERNWRSVSYCRGGDSDGTLGLKAIKERGGLTIAQVADGFGPGHRDMPDSAIASGFVDFAIPADQMGAKLAEFSHSSELRNLVDAA